MSYNFKPIEGDAQRWDNPVEPGVVLVNETEREKIEALFMGRKVVKADDEHLVLDNGTVVKAIGHDGGCTCSAGCYDLAVLNGVDNIITRVEFDYAPTGDDYYDDSPREKKKKKKKHPDDPEDKRTGYYRIFVFADNEKINLMQFDGSDGNGYYGTGFELLVREVN